MSPAVTSNASRTQQSIANPLFSADNTLMYFADGKRAVVDVVNALKEDH